MAYMLLILETREQRFERGEEEGRKVYQRMLDFAAELASRGVLESAQSLVTDSSGIRVQVRAGQRTLLDGPFTETKEMVGGFFLLRCQTRQEAIEIAAACPAAEWATVEVRELGPCFELPRRA